MNEEEKSPLPEKEEKSALPKKEEKSESRKDSGMIIAMAVIAGLVLIIALLSFAYIKADRRLDESNRAATSLQTALSNAKTELSASTVQAAGLAQQVSALRARLDQLADETSTLKSVAEANAKAGVDQVMSPESMLAALKKDHDKECGGIARPVRKKVKSPALRTPRIPPLPVGTDFHKSLDGRARGMIGVFSNYSPQYLPLMVTLRNPTTGDVRNLSFPVAPDGHVSIGDREGWRFLSGDLLVISSAGFKTARIRVP